MQATFDVIVPVFGLICCGYVLALTPVISKAAVSGLTNFVFMVATPALLFRSMAKGIDFATLDFRVLAAYYGGVLVLFALSFIFARKVFSKRLAENALFAMGGIFSNTVLLGIPLIYTAFGEAGLLIIMMIIAVHSPLLIGGTTVLIEIGEGRGEGGGARAIRQALKAILANPIIVAVVLGVLWAAAGWPMPLMVDRFTALLGGAVAPCALFSLGAAMVHYKIAGDLRQSLAMLVFKLLALPALVWVLAALVFQLPPLYIAVAVITAALPTGSNVYVLAQRYEIYVARAASGIVLSTGLSMATVALLIVYFAPLV